MTVQTARTRHGMVQTKFREFFVCLTKRYGLVTAVFSNVFIETTARTRHGRESTTRSRQKLRIFLYKLRHGHGHGTEPYVVQSYEIRSNTCKFKEMSTNDNNDTCCPHCLRCLVLVVSLIFIINTYSKLQFCI